MDLGLAGKVAVISGAGRGLGRTVAMTLMEEGAKLAVNDYYQDRAEAVAKEISDKGGEAIAVQADVTDLDQVSAMMKRVVDAWGRLDIVVHNAGIPAGMLEGSGIDSNFFQLSEPASWRRWVDLDFFGLLNLAKVAVPYMIDHAGGRILTIGSDAGRIGEPNLAVYSGAKAGTYGFLKGLAKEVGRHGITVNSVVSSAMEDTYMGQGLQGDSPELQERRKGMVRLYPLARSRGGSLGTTQDMANAVAFLVSGRASWITGQLLSVNGGYCMVD